ncbi:MAG: hypothetical protein ACYT04_70505 [Nostoc sp.]
MFKGFGRSKKKLVLEDNELTTGIVQYPVTLRWQTWISFTGHDIQCITAHNQREDANRVAKQMADAWSEGKLPYKGDFYFPNASANRPYRQRALTEQFAMG